MMNRIKELREKRGLSQEQLASKADTSWQQISRLERGERRLTDKWMRRIAPGLGVAPVDLLPASDRQTERGGKESDVLNDAEKVALLQLIEKLDPRSLPLILGKLRDDLQWAAELAKLKDIPGRRKRR